MGSGQQYIQLWTKMFDYFTNEKGLNNLIWLMPFSGNPDSDYFPGTDYLDLAGPDSYDPENTFGALYNRAKGVIGNTIPIPLHECGTIPNVANMFNNNAYPYVLFSVWAQMEQQQLSAIQTAYSDSHTVTRDELPDF
jgi:hypothetical protein